METYNKNLKSLEAAYRTTNYTVYPSDESDGFTIQIGKHCSSADSLLTKHLTLTWAFITAENPRSKRLPNSENSRRTLQLRSAVEKLNLKYLTGEGVGDPEIWKGEFSFFILGIPKDLAQSIASQFEQLAFVFGENQKPAELIWCLS